MVNAANAKLFMTLFRGRNDIYARRWEKNGKSGYSPAYEFNWPEFMAFKAKGGRLSDFPNKKLKLLTVETVLSHLEGKETIGIYPLLEDNTSYFIAADFDKQNWQEDCKNFVNICKEYNIPVYLERSRSGTGAHSWIFFEEKYPSQKARSIVLELIKKALKLSEFEKEVSFDRLFPNQNFHTNKEFGNLIALPFQGNSLKNGNTAFIDKETFEIIPDQWGYIKNIKKISTEKVYEIYQLLFSNNVVNPSSLKSKKRSNSIEITLDNQISLPKSSLNPALIHFLKNNLNFFNNEYLIKKRLGISTYQTEKYFKLINETSENILIPRGFADQLLNFCSEQNTKYKIIDKRKLKSPVKFKSKINLYDYQEEAVKDIEKKDFGVIVAPSGSGKTIIGLDLIARKSQPTLILVHRKQLLDQWIERIQSFLGIGKHEIGQLSGRNKKTGEQITVAMMQTLIKMEDIKKLSEKFGTIIVDECHHVPAKTFRELIVNFNPYYFYGLTATPKRKYNDEKLIYYYIGDIIVNIDPNKEQTSKLKADTVLNIKETELSVPFDYKTDTFEILSKILVFDSLRNKIIVTDIIKEVMKVEKF